MEAYFCLRYFLSK